MDKISLILKIIGYVRSLFWKEKDLVYINSTKKIFDTTGIDKIIPTRGVKFIVVENKTHKIGFKFVKNHFRKMKISLYQIQRNISETSTLAYAGYASVPFAVFDGYCLGDNRDYQLFDTTKNENGTYKIDFSKKRTKNNTFKKINATEVSLFVSSSFEVDNRHGKTDIKFNYMCLINDKVDDNYLSEVFYFVTDFLDHCRVSGVKKIHIYCASRQLVSFIIGTAIQSHHPEVIVYEFENNKYTWGLSIQNAKIIKGGKQI